MMVWTHTVSQAPLTCLLTHLLTCLLAYLLACLLLPYFHGLAGYTLRTEARNSGDGSDTVDGLDKNQRDNLESLYATLPDEPGWLVHTSGREGQEVLLRRMFQEEIDKATQQASAQQRADSAKRSSEKGDELGKMAVAVRARSRARNASGKARA
jgi:hypothetical protein